MSDLIKRQDAINAINQVGWLEDSEYESRILAIPSADRPQGEWIYHRELMLDKEYYPSRFECDQCHHYVIAGNDRNFCPNCGARMKGADDE